MPSEVDCPSQPSTSSLLDSSPIAFRLQDRPPTVDWLPLSAASADGRFFEELVTRYRARHPDATPVRSGWAELGRVAAARPTLPLHGAIFHVSRCGSTVVSNVLAALPQNLVIVEPASVGAVLDAALHDHPPELRERWLRELCGALGHRWRTDAAHCLIKFTSWNVRQVSLIQRVFPALRWIFVYREPVEVMVSVLREPTSWMALRARNPMLAARRFGFSIEELIGMSQEEYCARVLAGLFDAAISSHGPHVCLLNHRQMSGSIAQDLLAFFRIDADARAIGRMADAQRCYSKAPHAAQPFQDDSADKRRSASAAIRAMADRWLVERYARLEELRARQR